jgi:high-affinity Fe2+/Pb2+ permease
MMRIFFWISTNLNLISKIGLLSGIVSIMIGVYLNYYFGPNSLNGQYYFITYTSIALILFLFALIVFLLNESAKRKDSKK